MGLIRELYDELIPLPKDKVHEFNRETKINTFYFRFSYAFLNAIFQIIDCIIIPFYAWLFLANLKHQFSVITLIIFILLGFSSVFSIIQVLYWFIKPSDDYISLKDRILGETAIGAFLSSVLKLKIAYYLK
jgi:uncharacterized membrane protein YuzA (DUF378 family)